MPAKYRAKRTSVDGISFASKGEAARYVALRDAQARGEIVGLELQPRFRCVVGGKTVCSYVADFRYAVLGRDGLPTGIIVTEDFKGCKTPVYRLKRKLMAACYPGVEITEVTDPAWVPAVAP